MNWDDLRVFLAVAEQGSLSAAARALKVSQPTVSRRLAALEGRIAARLFERLPDGLLLTAQGTALLPHARDMARAAEAADREQAGFAQAETGEVRISVAEVTAQFLIERLDRLRAKAPAIEFEIVISHISANLSRREADLLIRYCVPDYGALIGRKLGVMAHAVYGSKRYLATRPAGDADLFGTHDWTAWDEEHQYMPGAAWLNQRLNGRPTHFRTNNGMAMMQAVRHGAGLGILPCFAGDGADDLVRLGPPLAQATPDLYLLVHPDLRRVPQVRRVMTALVELFAEEAEPLSGIGTSRAAAE